MHYKESEISKTFCFNLICEFAVMQLSRPYSLHLNSLALVASRCLQSINPCPIGMQDGNLSPSDNRASHGGVSIAQPPADISRPKVETLEHCPVDNGQSSCGCLIDRGERRF